MSSLAMLLALGLSAAPADDPRRDALGAPLPSGAIARLGTTRFWQSAGVSAVALSPDGKILATGGASLRGRYNQQIGWDYPADATVRLWDTTTGKDLRHFSAPEDIVDALCFSPDGKLLAGHCRNLVCVWDAYSTRELHRFREVEEVQTFGCPAKSIRFSADMKQLRLIEPIGSVDSWDLTGAARHRHWEAPPSRDEEGRCRGAALSPDGRLVAWCLEGLDLTPLLSVHDTTTGQKLYEKTMPKQSLSAPSVFSPDGKLLAHPCRDGILFLNARTGKQVRKVHGRSTRCLEFTPDGAMVAGILKDGGVQLWETRTGRLLKKLPHRAGRDVLYEHGSPHLRFSADGRTLAAAGANVLLWDVASGELRPSLPGHRDSVQRLSFGPDGRQLFSAAEVLCTWDSNWRLKDCKPALCRSDGDNDAFSPDGHFYVERDADGYISVKHAGTNKEVRRLGRPTALVPGVVHALAVSAHGRRVSALTVQKEHWLAEVYDLASGNNVRRVEFKDEAKRVEKFWSPRLRGFDWSLSAPADGGLLAWHHRDGEILVADLNARAVRQVSPPDDADPDNFHTSHLLLAFSPNGRYLAAASDGRQDGGKLQGAEAIRVFEVATWREVLRLDLRQADGTPALASSLTFSPDSRLLAVGRLDEDVARIWEVASGAERCVFAGHSSAVRCLAFAPDGKVLAAGSSDTTILVWDMTGALTPTRKAPLRPDELNTLWSDLAGTDGSKVEQAVRTLTHFPAEAVPFLAARLRPALDPEPVAVAQLVANLRDARFAVRERAVSDLQKLHLQADPALRETLARAPEEELRRRIERLLDKAHGPIVLPQLLRDVRAVEVLEKANTKAARTLLKELARGSAGARQTTEARAALKALKK